MVSFRATQFTLSCCQPAGALLPVLPLSPSMLATNLVAVSAQLGSRFMWRCLPVRHRSLICNDLHSAISSPFVLPSTGWWFNFRKTRWRHQLPSRTYQGVRRLQLPAWSEAWCLYPHSFLIFPITTKYMYQLREAKAADKNVKGGWHEVWYLATGYRTLLNLAKYGGQPGLRASAQELLVPGEKGIFSALTDSLKL